MLILDGFDPVLIADKLKAVADGLVDDVTFRATLNDLKKAVAQEVSYCYCKYLSPYVYYIFSHL